VKAFTKETIRDYLAANIWPGSIVVSNGLACFKGAIHGTSRSRDAHHTDRDLAAYDWRFNRRFVLAKNLEGLARAAARTAPVPHRTIANVRPEAETSG
jgi:hypothetical protein